MLFHFPISAGTSNRIRVISEVDLSQYPFEGVLGICHLNAPTLVRKNIRKMMIEAVM